MLRYYFCHLRAFSCAALDCRYAIYLLLMPLLFRHADARCLSLRCRFFAYMPCHERYATFSALLLYSAMILFIFTPRVTRRRLPQRGASAPAPIPCLRLCYAITLLHFAAAMLVSRATMLRCR